MILYTVSFGEFVATARDFLSFFAFHSAEISLSHMTQCYVLSSVADPCHFGVDPDPGIYASD
jgi:hypothetical protein